MKKEVKIIFPLTVAKLVENCKVTKQAVYKLLKKHKISTYILANDPKIALWVQMHFNLNLQVEVTKHYVEMCAYGFPELLERAQQHPIKYKGLMRFPILLPEDGHYTDGYIRKSEMLGVYKPDPKAKPEPTPTEQIEEDPEPDLSWDD